MANDDDKGVTGIDFVVVELLCRFSIGGIPVHTDRLDIELEESLAYLFACLAEVFGG